MNHERRPQLRVPCPSCHRAIAIDAGIIGRGIRCDGCDEVLSVAYPIAERVFSDAEAMPAIIESGALAAG
jgi:hypothetical protein